MSEEVTVIIRCSKEVQHLLDQQDTNLYEEIQNKLPAIRFSKRIDPDIPAGRRDVITVIIATSTLIGSLTPIIIRLLNQITPPNRSVQWKIEETETHQPDGSVSYHRIYTSSSEEQRPWASLPYPQQPKQLKSSASEEGQ